MSIKRILEIRSINPDNWKSVANYNPEEILGRNTSSDFKWKKEGYKSDSRSESNFVCTKYDTITINN